MRKVTLANYWHPIGTSDDVTQDPKQFKLLGEKLIAFRDAEGAVAFKDLCVHRGTALSLGWITHGRLTCPYHGWQYDRTGRCVHIPSLPEGASIPLKARATAYRVSEAYGLVWVAIDEPVQPIPAWPDNAWENPEYRVFLSGRYVWMSSAGRAVENALDFAHFNIVHKGLTELADGPVIKPYEVKETEFGLECAYEDGRLRREYSLYMPFTLHDKKTVIATDQGGTWSERGKAQLRSTTILTFIAAPTDVTVTNLYVFVARNHSLEMEDREFTRGPFELIMEQDRRIVESQRPLELPTDLREELHLKVPDAASILYRTLLGKIQRPERWTNPVEAGTSELAECRSEDLPQVVRQG